MHAVHFVHCKVQSSPCTLPSASRLPVLLFCRPLIKEPAIKEIGRTLLLKKLGCSAGDVLCWRSILKPDKRLVGRAWRMAVGAVRRVSSKAFSRVPGGGGGAHKDYGTARAPRPALTSH